MSPRTLVLSTAAVLAASVLGAAGCGDDDGGGSGSSATQPVRVALDFTPNAVHAPIFTAARTGATAATACA